MEFNLKEIMSYIGNGSRNQHNICIGPSNAISHNNDNRDRFKGFSEKLEHFLSIQVNKIIEEAMTFDENKIEKFKEELNIINIPELDIENKEVISNSFYDYKGILRNKFDLVIPVKGNFLLLHYYGEGDSYDNDKNIIIEDNKIILRIESDFFDTINYELKEGLKTIIRKHVKLVNSLKEYREKVEIMVDKIIKERKESRDIRKELISKLNFEI